MPRIEPIKGSSALFGRNNRDFNRVSARILSWTSTVDQDSGERGQFDMGTYPYERFPESHQNWRPIYKIALRQFDVRHPDGTLWTQDDAKKCLADFPLNFPSDWHNPRDAGKPIERINIHDADDPYFNHPDWISIGMEGSVETGETDFDKVKLAMYAGNPGVKADDGSEYRPGDVRFYVKNPDMEIKRLDSQLDAYMDNQELFSAMYEDEDKLRDMLTLLGFSVEENASIKTLRRQLLPFINDVTTENGVQRSKLFRSFAKLEPKERKLRATIKRANSKGILQQGAGVFKFKDGIVGRNFDEVYAFFSDMKNSQSLDLLKQELSDSR
jgi:hypothetical protein